MGGVGRWRQVDPNVVSDHELERLFSLVDGDSSGFIDAAEFEEFIKV
eukprot:SAG11_NODE_25347_length_360_cov_0.593870_1_plen_46_part_10